MQKSTKLIAFDLDGTVLRGYGTLSKADENAMIQAEERGYVLAAVTGRPYSALPRKLKRLKAVRYCACATGAQIWDKKTKAWIKESFLSRRTVKALVDALQPEDLGIILSTTRKRYLNAATFKIWTNQEDAAKPARNILVALALVFESSFSTKIVSDFYKILKKDNAPVVKLEFVYPKTEPDKYDKILRQISLYPDISVAETEGNHIEITAKNATKGEAIACICGQLGLSRDDVVAFGDGGNDMTMRDNVKALIAMENGSDELKAIADYIAPPVSQNGFSQMLKKLGIVFD